MSHSVPDIDSGIPDIDCGGIPEQQFRPFSKKQRR
jgi:hypothetical protein